MGFILLEYHHERKSLQKLRVSPTIISFAPKLFDLLILLLTSPGERIFLPDFGTPLKDLIFDPNDSTIADRAKTMISNSISQWEPRIIVDQINVTTTVDRSILSPYDDLSQSGAILTIQIAFRSDDNIAEVQSLVLEVPLPGGS